MTEQVISIILGSGVVVFLTCFIRAARQYVVRKREQEATEQAILLAWQRMSQHPGITILPKNPPVLPPDDAGTIPVRFE